MTMNATRDSGFSETTVDLQTEEAYGENINSTADNNLKKSVIGKSYKLIIIVYNT